MAKNLPEGAVEILDWKHDPAHHLRTPERREARADRESLAGEPRARALKSWEIHANTFPPVPCNLILLPDLITACACFRLGIAKLKTENSNFLDINENNVIAHVMGEKCHISAPVLAQVIALADSLTDAVRELSPSLAATPKHYRAEIGDIWDAGLIAEGDERPCFSPRYDGPEPSKGQGNGAYRILINTDTSFGRSDSENLATTLCLCNVLSHFGPVEIWIQQGWIGYGGYGAADRQSGVVSFRVGEMSSINPSALAFWLGSPLRDGTFSYAISRFFGRSNGGTSQSPAVPCDLYTANACGPEMPDASYALALPDTKKGKEELAVFAQWCAQICAGIIYPESVETANV